MPLIGIFRKGGHHGKTKKESKKSGEQIIQEKRL
jgi:hypothetical protein